MTQEEKSLLLKDLCARLPYGVKILARNPITKENEVQTIDAYKWGYFECSGFGHRADIVRPYLRPMSSMTEEEREYYDGIRRYLVRDDWEVVDWLNAHYFDYRGLISMGLGIDCTGLNIY